MSHGAEILKALRAEMTRLGRKPSDVESGAVIDAYLDQNAVKLKKKRKPGMPKSRARDEIFDLLAKLDGQDVKQLTRHGAARVGEAKKQILEVLEGLTTVEVIEQINGRWGRWCQKHTDKKTQTVMALITHWGELGGGPKTKAEKFDPYKRPDASWDWRSAAIDKYPDSAFAERVAGGLDWFEVQLDVRKELLADRERPTTPL